MKLEKNELAKCEQLRITYEGDRTDFMDDLFTEAAKKAGFSIGSTGYNFSLRRRDMSFNSDKVHWKPDSEG